MRMTAIKLTKAELDHIMHLIEMNEREGEYYGDPKQYWKRSLTLKQKLQTDNMRELIDGKEIR